VAGILLLVSSTAVGETFQFGDFSFKPGLQSSNFNPVFDLTAVNVSVSYQVDLRGVTKTDPALGPYVEVGLREVGAENFNPGVFGQHTGGKGGWMISGVADLVTDANLFDVDDKHNLQSAGDLDETKYDAVDQNTVTDVFGSLAGGKGIYFDRDGVGVGEDASAANTDGNYLIVIDFHAVDTDQGTMFATVNGLTQGFMPGLNGDIDPAGAGFTGDMTRMQAFLGGLMDDGTGTIRVSDLTVVTSPIPEPATLCLLMAAMVGSCGWFRIPRDASIIRV
jgi:hypothetical protein